jgi:hypothetical protein
MIFFVPVLGLMVFGLLGRRALRRRSPDVQAEAQAGMITATEPPRPS